MLNAQQSLAEEQEECAETGLGELEDANILCEKAKKVTQATLEAKENSAFAAQCAAAERVEACIRGREVRQTKASKIVTYQKKEAAKKATP